MSVVHDSHIAKAYPENMGISSQPVHIWPFILLKSIYNFFNVIWGFTESDFATFVLPDTAFGILGALATIPLTDANQPSMLMVLQRLPAVVVFNWSNLLIFDLANQRSPDSVAEDYVNKPWRPIPRGKITTEQTRRLMLVTVPLSLYLNHYLGVWGQGILIHLITWLYNDLRGSDEVAVRELLIAIGYAMFNGGSLQIASGCSQAQGDCELNSQGIAWTGIISAVIFTTMQVQDLKDQEGDRLRGRRTVVLFFGERVSRGSIAFFVIFWSVTCAYFWQLRWWGFALPVAQGLFVAWRVVTRYSQDEDRQTWKLWCLWLICLYILPVIKGRE